MIRRASSFSFAFALASFVVACGGSSGSLFNENNGSGNNASGGANGDGTGGFSNDPVGTGAACVTSVANAQRLPVDLVFMYDKSGSMGDPAEGGDPNVKWIPLTNGMTGFFGDPKSAGINASLQFFPAPGNLNATCAFPYATPKVPLTQDTAQLTTALTSTQPQGGTPTLPALDGAIAYAQQLQQKRPGEKVAVVLVTDGVPGFYVNGQNVPGCTNNDISHVAASAQAAFSAQASIPTYVIGVGPDLQDLNAIASAGGTGQAYMVSVANPTQTTQDLLSALGNVRAKTVTCDFSLPAPPAGQSLDTGHVNVAYDSGSNETVLPYSGDCSNAQGWHYDDPNAPTRIQLCSAVCSTVEGDQNAALKIAMGCQTKQATK